MRFVLSAASAALLAGCATAPAQDISAPSTPLTPLTPLPASVTSELPRNARPYHYAIEVVPDAANLAFTGRVGIDLELFEPGRSITVNSHGLDIAGATVTPAQGGAAIPVAVTLDPASESATFTAPEALAAGRYRLAIDYSGSIGRKPSGFFALDYPDKRTGEPARALFTQFEIPDAREFAPMFDEPSYKATFDLSAVVPAAQMAVSNMPVLREEPLGGGTKRVVFATSPKMSSYLLFFALGDFERLSEVAADGTDVGIVSPAGSGETARYALDAAVELMPYYNDYFGVAYPLPKLDNVAGPGGSLQFGAMENWGAIFTFEKYLLLDPRSTSPDLLEYLHVAQTHEIAHQWFGNLVTMAWWDDLWLNEGFASWMENKATEHFRPDWNLDVGRVNSREAAMGLDALVTTHPVVLRSATAAEADMQFDSIAYSKGETVLTMLEAFAGEDTWRDGIRLYMRRHAYGNTTTSDLWQAIEDAGAEGILPIARAFTTQQGVPLVKSTARCEAERTLLDLTQSEFSRDRPQEVAAQDQRWPLPMTILAADGSKHPLLLEGSATMALPGCGPVIVNGGQLSYFRTLYTPDMLAPLAAGLPAFSPADQLGLVRDNLALSAASYQDYAPSLDLLVALKADANPLVAETASSQWASFYDILEDDSARQRLARVMHDEWFGRLQQLGFDPRAGESLSDATLRAQLVSDLGKVGDPAVVAEARRRFARLATDRSALDGPLKTAWLVIAARSASEAEWDLLRKLAFETTESVERGIFLARLGGALDETLARKALGIALGGEVEPSESLSIIAAVAGNHPELAFEYVLEREDRLAGMIEDVSRPGYVAGLAGASTDPDILARIKQMRDERPQGERIPFDRVIASFENRLATYPRIRQQVGAWLAAHD